MLRSRPTTISYWHRPAVGPRATHQSDDRARRTLARERTASARTRRENYRAVPYRPDARDNCQTDRPAAASIINEDAAAGRSTDGAGLVCRQVPVRRLRGEFRPASPACIRRRDSYNYDGRENNSFAIDPLLTRERSAVV